MIWQLFPHLLLLVQNSAMDYISSFFCVVDCYLVIECLCFIPLTHSSSDIVDRSFNGKSYLQLLFDFVNESIFDAELGYQEQIYGVGILMIIVQYLYSAIPLTASRLEKVDSVVQPAVEIVQRFVAAKEADITKLMAEDEEEDIKAFYLEQARDCIVSLDRFSHLQCRALMVVESALILRPQQTLAFLVSVNYADAYMNSFVTYLDAHESFLATHLALLSLAALFTVPLEALPASYRAQLPLLFMTCLQLMAQLQPLKKQREEAKDEDVDYDDLMDRLNGQNFKQNDWGLRGGLRRDVRRRLRRHGPEAPGGDGLHGGRLHRDRRPPDQRGHHHRRGRLPAAGVQRACAEVV